MRVYQAIVVGLSKEYQNRFGLYSSEEEAKFALEYNFVDEDLVSLKHNVSEAYIEEIELDSMPDVGKRQGRKLCFFNDDGHWELYKPHKLKQETL